MIESIENAIQLLTTGGCTAAALVFAMRSKDRAWILLGLFTGVYFLGDLYWLLYLVFYSDTPSYSNISDLSWYAAYLFLLLLMFQIGKERELPHQVLLRRKILWIIPAFTAASCVFFMRWGDYASNLVAAGFMTLLFLYSLDGLLSAREGLPCKGRPAFVYAIIFVFCLIEYGLWITSCYWMGDTLRNPYFWFDGLMTIVILFFPAALRKAVSA